MRKYLDIPLTLIVTTVLTVAMLWPMAQTSMTSNGLDKVLHFIAFAVLVLPFTITGRYSLLVLFLTASAFGGAIELIQSSFNRSTEFNDWIADVAGVLLELDLEFCISTSVGALNLVNLINLLKVVI